MQSTFEHLQEMYGAKAASLIYLASLGIEVPGGLHVPEVHPFAHSLILKVFKDAGLDIDQAWKKVLANKPENIDLDSYIIDSAKNGAIAKLCTDIVETSKKKQFKYLLSITQFQGKPLTDFISKSATQSKNAHAFMCRSSGDEDLNEISNPGGNESHPAKATIESVAEHVGLVLASYFKPKSFEQREIKEAQNQDSLAKLPQCSVLLQNMIGEDVILDPNIASDPNCVSGVVFSRKPDGYTEDLVFINAAYGHGEGVVQGSVPCDMYVISGKNRHLDQHIANKTDRIAPVQGKGLESVPVDPAKANKAALTPVQARRLHFICEQITAAYGGKPLDIEWVFKDDKFYIVQVRDLPKPKQRIEPAYVTEIDPTKVLTSGTSVVAGCDVRRLDALDDCIIRDNLADALKYYLTHRDKQAAVKAIFVKEGLQTSHEANYFRYLGIPVIMVKDTDDLRYTLQKKNSLTLCCQSGRVYNDSYDNYLNSEKIKPGWFKHPHKMSLNLKPLKLYKNANDETAASYQDTFPQLTPRDTYLSERDVSFWNKVDGIFTLLRNDTNVENVRELRDLITSAAKAISKQISDRSLRSELATVLEHSWIACDALISIIQDQELATEDLEQYTLQKLLALQRIETILTQDPDPQLHTQLSFAQILREATEQARIHKIIDTIEPPITDPDIRELLTQGLKASKACLNLEFKQAFEHYLCHLDRDAMIHTCKMLMDYKRDGILELAVNLMPDIDTSNISSYSKIYAHQKRIHESFYSSELVKQLQKIKNLNSLWRSRIGAWKDADKFATLIADFQRFIDSFLASIDLLKTIIDPLQKQLLINNLKESLDIFDLSLKELSASTDYDDNKLQGKNFSQLLMHYQNVSSELLFSIEGVFEIKAKTQATETARSEFYTVASLNEHFNEAAKQVSAHAEQVNYVGQLAPSGTFDVSKAVFTNSAAPQRTLHGMTTLIDVFTLLHQNALAALALHQNSNMKLRLPEDIQSVIDDVINNIETTHASGKPTFISGTLEAPLLCLTYNYPLRNHSANITLKYDMNNSQHATLQMDLFMQNEGNRCVNTRVLARNFQATHEQFPIQLQSYNAIESAPTAWQSGTFFANHFIWDIDLANCNKDEDQLTVFANHLGDLLDCTFEVPMLDINDNRIDPKEYHLNTYVPGMFNYSFAGLEDVCKSLSQSYDYALMLNVVKNVVDAVNERIVYGPVAELEILYPQFYALAAVFEALDQSPYSAELDSYMEANAQIDLSNLLNIDDPTTFLHMAEFAYTILDTSIDQQDLYSLLLEWLVRHPDNKLTETFADEVHILDACYNALSAPAVLATSLEQARKYLQVVKNLTLNEAALYEKACSQMLQWKSQWNSNDAKAYNQATFTYDRRLPNADKKNRAKLEHHYAPDMFDESYSGLDDLLELLEFEAQSAIITRVFYDIVERLPTMERLRTNTLIEYDKNMIELLKSYLEYNQQDSTIVNTIQTKIHSFLDKYAPITILTPPFVQLLAATFDPAAKSLILDSIVRSTSALEFMQNIEIFRTTHECTHAEIGVLQLKWLQDHPQHVAEFAKDLPRFTLQYITFANKTYDTPDDYLLIMKVCGHLEDWSEMYVGRAFTNIVNSILQPTDISADEILLVKNAMFSLGLDQFDVLRIMLQQMSKQRQDVIFTANDLMILCNAHHNANSYKVLFTTLFLAAYYQLDIENTAQVLANNFALDAIGTQGISLAAQFIRDIDVVNNNTPNHVDRIILLTRMYIMQHPTIEDVDLGNSLVNTEFLNILHEHIKMQAKFSQMDLQYLNPILDAVAHYAQQTPAAELIKEMQEELTRLRPNTSSSKGGNENVKGQR